MPQASNHVKEKYYQMKGKMRMRNRKCKSSLTFAKIDDILHMFVFYMHSTENLFVHWELKYIVYNEKQQISTKETEKKASNSAWKFND